MTTPTTHPPAASAAPRLRVWKEVAIAVGFYLVYSVVRNQFGSNGAGARTIAFRHARGVIRVEKALGLFFEPKLQRWYLDLPAHGFISVWNDYYGSLHFIVTIAMLVVAFRRIPARYPFLRTMLAGATACALIGFATYTLMPPRLLDDTSKFGACAGRTEGCHGYGLQDTIAVHGGLWQFGKGAMSNVSNQYAAMPSLHFGWSSWCAIAFIACYPKKWWRWLGLLYPAATLFCILVTANHYWLDAVGGAVVLTMGFGIAVLFERIRTRFWPARTPAPADTASAEATTPAAT